jgi:hypothetical protein
MKKIFLLLVPCTLFLMPLLFSQNIGIGTTTPAFKLDVRSGSINTDSVYRIGGSTVLSVKGTANTFIGANVAENNLGAYNTASGRGALNSNTTGIFNTASGRASLSFNTTGSFNMANGSDALYSNTIGSYNTASGFSALYNNATGSYNTANGKDALYSNTTGNYNTASGFAALSNNTTGDFNTANGVEALKFNTTGVFNTANGYLALFNNTNGFANTAVGYGALSGTTTTFDNTAIGFNAGNSYNNGVGNVFVGSLTDVNAAGLNSVIAIGYATTATASSTARFGNPSTTSYGGWAGWTNLSDGRYKKNVKENVPGLEFINKLRPVTYTMDATGLDAFYHKNPASRTAGDKKSDSLSTGAAVFFQTALLEKEKITYTGFIAQEVEATAKAIGFDFSGVDAAKNENDTYGLRYAEFVVPLVKAVQEQQLQFSEMKKEIDLLKEQNKLLLQLLKNKN